LRPSRHGSGATTFRADDEMTRADDLKKLGLSEEHSDIVAIRAAYPKVWRLVIGFTGI